MKKLNHFNKDTVLTAAGVFASRLGILSANVSPLGSFGFFGNSPWLYALTIVLFDVFIGGFYTGFIWTYLGFAAYPIIGSLVKKSSHAHQAIALPLASGAFFLLSNFGVWLNWYPATWEGLITCYSLALPFFWRTLFGDILFGYSYLLLQSPLIGRIREKLSYLKVERNFLPT